MKKELHFPTILGLIILIAGTAAAVVLFRNSRNQTSQASNDCSPSMVQVTNITDKSADLSFTTNTSCIVTLTINKRLIQDARQIPNTSSYTAKTHYFMVDGLSPGTQYTYSITGGKDVYTNSSYKFSTAQKSTTTIPTSNLAWGKVYYPGKIPASTSIIYLSIPGASPLSSFVTSNGNWNISLSTTLNAAKNNWFVPSQNSTEDITIISEDNDPLLLTGNTSYNNPVPDIIIGQTKELSFANTSVVSTPTVVPLLPTSVPLNKDLNIISPTEGELIPATTAQFIGVGNPGSIVTLQLQTTPVLTTEITVAADGSWRWSLSEKLSVGQKTLTAMSNGQTVTRLFQVSNDVGGPAYVASPSAEIIVSPTPTLIPTITLKPTRVSQPSTSSGIPVSGDNTPTVFVTAIGVMVVFIGLLLFR